jgi:predicted lipoprotein with Yx(FWY)xxD motif
MSPKPTAERSRLRTSLATGGAALVMTALAVLGPGAAGWVPAGASTKHDTVKLVAHQGLGRILVDGAGMTVYIFTADHPNEATCTGGCAGVWPPLTIAKGSKVVAGPGISHLGTIADGKRLQVTWNKHPLYLYALDTGPGVVNGNGVKQGSATWYAATSARVDAKWPSSATTSTSTSGGSAPPGGYGY